MARPPSRYHPFHTIRSVLAEADGKEAGTQEGFARIIGREKAAITIKRIEAGSLKLSSHLAVLITAATGVDTTPLLAGKLSKPKTVEGKEFTLSTLQRWRTELNTVQLARLCDELAVRLTNVFRSKFDGSDQPGFRMLFCEVTHLISQHSEPSKGASPVERLLPGITSLAQCSSKTPLPCRMSFIELFEMMSKIAKPNEPPKRMGERS